MACQHRPNRRCFPVVCDLTPKARKRFFTKVLKAESAHFCILCGPYVIVTTRTNHGNSAVSVRQSARLGSRSGAAAVLKRQFFLNYAPPPHPTTKPSRGWLRVGDRKPRCVLFCSMPVLREIKLRRKKGPTSWGVPASRVFFCLTSRGIGLKQNRTQLVFAGLSETPSSTPP